MRWIFTHVRQRPCETLPTPCWIWRGAANPKGYGHLRIGKRWRMIHHVMHTFFVGPVSKGEQVHHKCLQHLCCNPEHLVAVTGDLNRYYQAMGIGDPDAVKSQVSEPEEDGEIPPF